ncbi:hypothetical protein [Granulosicoccus antarcticus]|uniref:Lipoprotein n=1 Tax=Granulosicoccus antarcticus IMCC3135 TaxID=1192854 RepID=A0A2Z2NW84_9GAMM|nr:hypothetical protein [Granulosicoccus antarcticus]ASJ73968.1 hypothetical protein IMCC3135_19445 [Granulosicoccus antarcticus IMCC3135]
MKIQIALLSSIILSGCTHGTRNCSTFDLPAALSWSTVDNVGESATFTSASGENLTMTLMSRIDNEPYEGGDRFGADSVVCLKYSDRQYEFDDGDAGMFIKITQREEVDQPYEEQSIIIESTPQAPSGSALNYKFYISTASIAFYGEDGGEVFPTSTVRLLDDTNIGGENYDVAIEEIFTDTAEITAATPDGVDTISSLVFARSRDGVRDGLVRIGFTNGDVYTRAN